MQRPLDPGAIVLGERADAADDVLNILPADKPIAQISRMIHVPRFRLPSEIEDDFYQRFWIALLLNSITKMRRERRQQQIQIIGCFDSLF